MLCDPVEEFGQRSHVFGNLVKDSTGHKVLLPYLKAFREEKRL